MDQKNEISTIESLPNEILLMIFSDINSRHLNLSVSKVCRRWKYLISHILVKLMHPEDEVKIHGGVVALLVTPIIFSCIPPRALVSKIATLIPHLKELTISANYYLGNLELHYIESLCHNLRHLDIFTEKNYDESTPISCNITSLVVNNTIAPRFLSKMKNPNRVIKAFHMYGIYTYYPIKEMEGFLRYHSVNLSELTLRCSEFEDSSFKIISLCKGLTSLQLYGCSQLTTFEAPYLTNLTKLRCLHLTGAKMVCTDTLLDFIHYLPPNIVELNLSLSRFGDEHCSALVAALPNLRCFELWRSRVSTSHLVNMIQQLQFLEYFDTDAIFDYVHKKALLHHQSLKNLRCRNIRFSQIISFHLKETKKAHAEIILLLVEGILYLHPFNTLVELNHI